MVSAKQRAAARRNIKKAQAALRRKKGGRRPRRRTTVRRRASPRRRVRRMVRRRRRKKGGSRAPKTVSLTFVAIALEALSLLGIADRGIKGQLDAAAAGSQIPAATFLGAMVAINVAAMFFPNFARKVNAKLGKAKLRI